MVVDGKGRIGEDGGICMGEEVREIGGGTCGESLMIVRGEILNRRIRW